MRSLAEYLDGRAGLAAVADEVATLREPELHAALREVVHAAAGGREPAARRADDLLLALPAERTVPLLEGDLRSQDAPGTRNAARLALAALVRHGSAHALHRLETLLREDPESDVRILSATVLADAAAPASLPALVDALGDPHPNVVAAATEALAVLHDERAFAPLRTVLSGGHAWARLAAAEALGALGIREAVDPLLDAARDPETALAAIPSLGKIPHPAALDALTELLAEGGVPHPDEAWRAVARVLASVGTEPVRDRLRAAARGAEERFRGWAPERRSEAALLLGLAGTPTAVDTLLSWAEEEATRDAAAAAIGILPRRSLLALPERFGEMSDGTLRVVLAAMAPLPPDVDPGPLLECLASRDAEIRAEAAEALASLPPEALEPAIEEMTDRPALRRGLAELLSRVRPSPYERLSGLLGDEDEEVRRLAARGLSACASPSVLKAVRSALDREESRAVVRELLIALARCGGSEALPDLERAIADPDAGLRYVAAEAMGRSRDPGAVRLLLDALSDRHPGVRAAALRALGRLGDPAASEPVAAQLRTASPDLRRVAGESLEHLAPERVRSTIRIAARDPDREVRIIAIDILRGFDDEESLRTIEEISETDSDPVVRRHARETVASGEDA